MRILHVVYECIPGSHAGGVQKMVLEVGYAQAERGDSVEIWTIGGLNQQALAPGLVVRYFPGRARFGSQALRAELMAEYRRFDVVHSHNTFLPLNLAAAAVARRGAKVFFHAHGALDPQLIRGWRGKALKKGTYVSLFERRNYDAACGVIGLTAIECEQIKAIGTKAAIFELHNGIKPQLPATPVATAAFRLRHRIAPGEPVVLFVGRITHKKGIHYLLDALALVRKRIPTAVLVICGGREQDTEYVASLDEQIARLNLDSHVRWAGFVDEVQKRAAFASCSVFAHPSYSEGMAIAVLEAMSFGAPTVVTPGCYMGSAVAAGALKLSQQDAENLSETIAELLEDQVASRLLAKTAQAYVAEAHSWTAIADRLAKIYEGTVPPHRPKLTN